MNFTLLQATIDHKIAIQNLMQFYMYDFSEYLKYDVEDNGLFAPYPDLSDYWADANKFPYIIIENGKYVGFVLAKSVSSDNQRYFSIAEFFILKNISIKELAKP